MYQLTGFQRLSTMYPDVRNFVSICDGTLWVFILIYLIESSLH